MPYLKGYSCMVNKIPKAPPYKIRLSTAIGHISPGQYGRVAGPLNTAGCVIVGSPGTQEAEVPLS